MYIPLNPPPPPACRITAGARRPAPVCTGAVAVPIYWPVSCKTTGWLDYHQRVPQWTTDKQFLYRFIDILLYFFRKCPGINILNCTYCVTCALSVNYLYFKGLFNRLHRETSVSESCHPINLCQKGKKFQKLTMPCHIFLIIMLK